MSVYCLDDMAYEELGKENEERRRETPEAPMNSDHAPTAEERSLESLLVDTQIRVRELERENRENDARIAELESITTQIPLLDQLLDKRVEEIERLRAKLRAVSDALEENLAVHGGWRLACEMYAKPDVDSLLARIRAIVEGK